MTLIEQLEKEAAEIVEGGRKAGLDWQVSETSQWKASALLRECERVLRFYGEEGSYVVSAVLARDQEEIALNYGEVFADRGKAARAMLIKLRSNAQ